VETIARERSPPNLVVLECAVIRRSGVSGLPASDRQDASVKRRLALRLDDFAWEAIQHESTRLGVSEEELVAYAVLYYLADIDSGRIARRIPRGLHPDAS
jgi:hypothetical protein